MKDDAVGKKLRNLREKCGYTQQQIANVLNIDRSTYSYYETGKTNPDISTLIILADVFSVSIEELFGQELKPSVMHDSEYSPVQIDIKNAKKSNHLYELSKEEKQLICFYRVSSPEVRKVIMDYIKKSNQTIN